MGVQDNSTGDPYPEDEALYTTQQAAERLRVSVRTVYNHRSIGLLDFIQACHKSPVYFTDKQLSEYRERINRKR